MILNIQWQQGLGRVSTLWPPPCMSPCILASARYKVTSGDGVPRGTEMCQPCQLMQTLLLLPGSSARCREGRGWENRGRLIAGPDLTFGPPRSSAKLAHHMVSQGGRPALPSASLPGRDEAPETGAPQSHLAAIHVWLG